MKSSRSNDNLLRSDTRHRGNDFLNQEYGVHEYSHRDSERDPKESGRRVNNVSAFNRKRLSQQEITSFKNGY